MSRTETKAKRRALPGEGNPPPGSVADERHRATLGMARAFVIGPVGTPVSKADPTTGRPRTFPAEGFATAARNEVISPPLDPLVLAMLPEQSAHLGKCIDAMVVNIDGFGHTFQRLVNTDDPRATPDLKKAVQTERIRLTNFFANCSPDDTFVQLRSKTRRDLETIGFGGWEVVRGPASNAIQFLNYVPGYRIRLARMERELVSAKQKMLVLNEDGSRGIKEVEVRRYFRRFVVVPPMGTDDKAVWFKQFGDPRDLDAETGRFAPEGARLPVERRANELLYWCIHSPRTPYGLPRWLGNMITVFGDRSAEEVNYTTLRNNNIPSMVVTVSNGRLTAGSLKRIREFVQTQIQGSPNWSRFLLIEGEPTQLQDGTDTGNIKIDIKPLTNEQMRDGMFQLYAEANRDKIRESFRLPPIFVGGADDYTRATADSSRKLADEQIFAPERLAFDSWLNKFLFPEMGVIYHRFVSQGPNVTDDQDLIKVLMAAERTGGMSPWLARDIIGDIMGRELPPITQIDPEVPFSLQLAEAVKNRADMDVGAQVTSLKAVDPGGDGLGDYIEAILKVRDTLEAELERRALIGEAEVVGAGGNGRKGGPRKRTLEHGDGRLSQ